MQLVWFKKDLRVEDNQAVYEAIQSNQRIIFLYIFEPEILNHPSFHASHWDFLIESLIDLREALLKLGSDLNVCIGEATQVFHELHKAYAFTAIHAHEETGHDISFKRDIRVMQWCKEHTVSFYQHQQTGVVRRLKTRDGWSRIWASRMKKDVFFTPKLNLKIAQPTDFMKNQKFHIPEKSLFSIPGSRRAEQQKGGRSEGLDTLNSFLTSRGMGYQKEMSSPVTAWTSCSRISPYLSFGCLSMREAYKATSGHQDKWRNEALQSEEKTKWLASLRSFSGRLRWHCHFMQKLEDEPRIEYESMVRAYDSIRTQSNQTHLDAWHYGMTGYPMVDACMRALHASGWINFRMRAMLVSFACYDLWQPWQKVAEILAPLFLDFEPGIHYSQVQMQAGSTGINTLRIYSPSKQVVDQDPDGLFIRRYVPELNLMPNQYLAQPWTAPLDIQNAAKCRLGKDYPMPIVDHNEAVKFARSEIMRIRKHSETRQEAQEMLKRHGSRKQPRRGKSKVNE